MLYRPVRRYAVAGFWYGCAIAIAISIFNLGVNTLRSNVQIHCHIEKSSQKSFLSIAIRGVRLSGALPQVACHLGSGCASRFRPVGKNLRSRPVRTAQTCDGYPGRSNPLGALHPELIPDVIAYRLYLSTISLGPNPTDTDRKRQRAQISQIGLQDKDSEALMIVLSEFRMKYDDYVQRYNQSAEAAAARNETADINGFFRKLDGLVQSTRATLHLRLTPEGLTQFEAFVQAEKRKMKVNAEEEQ